MSNIFNRFLINILSIYYVRRLMTSSSSLNHFPLPLRPYSFCKFKFFISRNALNLIFALASSFHAAPISFPTNDQVHRFNFGVFCNGEDRYILDDPNPQHSSPPAFSPQSNCVGFKNGKFIVMYETGKPKIKKYPSGKGRFRFDCPRCRRRRPLSFTDAKRSSKRFRLFYDGHAES